MKKILFIIDHLGQGGAEKITIQLADHLAHQGHQVSLAVLNGEKNKLAVPASINYIDLQLPHAFAFGKMWTARTLAPAAQTQLAQLQQTVQADLIVTGYNNGHWLAPYLKGNVWHWIHGELIERRATPNILVALKEFFRRIRHRRAFIHLFSGKKIIVVNQDLADRYQPLLPQSPIQVIANGVDIQQLRAQVDHAVIHKSWDVLFLGRLAPIKQADHAIRAFARSGLTGRMAIAGDGAERKKLEQLAQDLGVADRVDFLGWLNQPAQTIAQSRVLVLCSREEGFGLVIAEALMLSTPVVAYACSAGIKDQLKLVHAEAALVTPQDIQALSLKLAQVIQTPYSIDTKALNVLSLSYMASQFEALIDLLE